MALDKPITCVEEEYSLAPAALWRMRAGWRPVLLYLRGAGEPIAFFSPVLSLIGVWRFKRRPPRLADADLAALRGARVVKAEEGLGSYGNGGPGFVGLLLQPPKGPSTWVVFTLWGAHQWLTLGGDLVGEGRSGSGAHERRHRPIASLVGATVSEIQSDRDGTRITLATSDGPLALALQRDTSNLPPHGSGQARAFDPEADLRDAVVTSRRAHLWVEK